MLKRLSHSTLPEDFMWVHVHNLSLPVSNSASTISVFAPALLYQAMTFV